MTTPSEMVEIMKDPVNPALVEELKHWLVVTNPTPGKESVTLLKKKR